MIFSVHTTYLFTHIPSYGWSPASIFSRSTILVIVSRVLWNDSLPHIFQVKVRVMGSWLKQFCLLLICLSINKLFFRDLDWYLEVKISIFSIFIPCKKRCFSEFSCLAGIPVGGRQFTRLAAQVVSSAFTMMPIIISTSSRVRVIRRQNVFSLTFEEMLGTTKSTNISAYSSK